MRSCTVQLFKLAELEADAQAKAIDACRQFNVEHHDWHEFVLEDAKRIGAILGIEIEDIHYSGFWSQGDGACFEGMYQYVKGSAKALREYAPQDAELHRIARALQDVQQPAFYKLCARIKHRGHYYHRYCTDIEVFDGNGAHATAEQHDAIVEPLRDLMLWIYRTLEQEYEYQTSDAAVRESIEANEYEFTERGAFH